MYEQLSCIFVYILYDIFELHGRVFSLIVVLNYDHYRNRPTESRLSDAYSRLLNVRHDQCIASRSFVSFWFYQRNSLIRSNLTTILDANEFSLIDETFINFDFESITFTINYL